MSFQASKALILSLLLVSCLAVDEIESFPLNIDQNDQCATAQMVALTDTVQGYVSAEFSYADYYSVPIPSDGILTVTVVGQDQRAQLEVGGSDGSNGCGSTRGDVGKAVTHTMAVHKGNTCAYLTLVNSVYGSCGGTRAASGCRTAAASMTRIPARASSNSPIPCPSPSFP